MEAEKEKRWKKKQEKERRVCWWRKQESVEKRTEKKSRTGESKD